MKKCISLFVLLAAVTFLAYPAHAKRLKPGQSVPDIMVQDIEAKDVSILAYVGTAENPVAKKTLLVFFNSVCSNCITELKHLKEQVANKGTVNVVGVGIDMQGAEFVKAFAERLQLNFTVLADPTFTLGNGIGFSFTPSSAFIDENGVLIKAYYGYDDQTRDEINGLF
jgi:peroxiredoxin